MRLYSTVVGVMLQSVVAGCFNVLSIRRQGVLENLGEVLGLAS